MSVYSVVTNIVQPGRGQAAKLVKLEQSEWLPCTGRLTKLGLAQFINSNIYGRGERPSVNCGFDGLGLSLQIYAYPLTPGLSFSVHTSRGVLGDGLVEEVEKEEIVKIRPGEPVTIDYPLLRIVEARWQGNAYNQKMQQVPHPSLTVSADLTELVTTTDVYAWVKLRYLTTRYTYALRVEKREGAEQNKFTAVVYAIYKGNPVWLVIEPPPLADEFEGACGGGTSISGSPGGLPEPSGDRKTVIDYCKRRLISDTVTGT